MDSYFLARLVENVEEMIQTLSEQELYDEEMVLPRETAEQLKEELLFLQQSEE